MNVKKITYYTKNIDTRGSFLGVVNQGHWAEINVVYTRAGAVRGNHFHKHTNEVVFILKGEVEVELQDVKDKSVSRNLTLKAGEGIVLPPETLHVMRYSRDCEQISLLDRRFDPDDPDLHVP